MFWFCSAWEVKVDQITPLCKQVTDALFISVAPTSWILYMIYFRPFNEEDKTPWSCTKKLFFSSFPPVFIFTMFLPVLSGKKSYQGQGVQFTQGEKAGPTFNSELQQWSQ